MFVLQIKINRRRTDGVLESDGIIRDLYSAKKEETMALKLHNNKTWITKNIVKPKINKLNKSKVYLISLTQTRISQSWQPTSKTT